MAAMEGELRALREKARSLQSQVDRSQDELLSARRRIERPSNSQLYLLSAPRAVFLLEEIRENAACVSDRPRPPVLRLLQQLESQSSAHSRPAVPEYMERPPYGAGAASLSLKSLVCPSPDRL